MGVKRQVSTSSPRLNRGNERGGNFRIIFNLCILGASSKDTFPKGIKAPEKGDPNFSVDNEEEWNRNFGRGINPCGEDNETANEKKKKRKI